MGMLDRLRTVEYAAQAVAPAGFALLPWVGMASAAKSESGVGKAVPKWKKGQNVSNSCLTEKKANTRGKVSKEICREAVC